MNQLPGSMLGSLYGNGVSGPMTLVSLIFNPLRACAARVTVVGLCVCLSVYDYSHTTGYEAAYERYQQLQCYKGMKNNMAILLKRLRSRDMANMHNQHWLTSTRFSPFSAPWTKGLCIQVQRCSKPTHDHAASLREVGRGPLCVAQPGPIN